MAKARSQRRPSFAIHVARVSRAAVYAVLLAALTASFAWVLRPAPPAVPPPAAIETPERPAGAAPRTVGEAWRWQAFPVKQRAAAAPAAAEAGSGLFDVPSIRRALKDVALDDGGNVVLDGNALAQLKDAFATLETELSAAQLEELQRIIRTGLPGPAGQQAASIVADYYRYHQALKDFDAGVVLADDLAAAAARYEQLAALRQEVFGPDVAQKLFAQEEAYARYTLETMRVQSAPGLSPEQKEHRLTQLRQSLPPGVLPEKPGPDWERRYAAFAREKQAVLNAGLTESDKRAQIEQLLRQHFTDSEIEAARHYLPAPGG